MRRSIIKTTSFAFLTLVLSGQVNASQNQEDPNPAQAANLSPLTLAEKAIFRNAVEATLRDDNAVSFGDALRDAEAKPWFSQKALEWAFKNAAANRAERTMALLLTRANGIRLGQDCIATAFTSVFDEVKLTILDCLVQQDVANPLVTQANLDDALPKIAARGRLESLQRIFNLPQDRFKLSEQNLKRAMKSAAGWGELTTVEFLLGFAQERGLLNKEILNELLNSTHAGYTLSHPAEKLKQIRDVVNCLLNRNAEGPDQKTVDGIFGTASSYGRKDQNRFLMIMLLDRNTGALRTGLRPSDNIIKSVRKEAEQTQDAELLALFNEYTRQIN